MPVAFNPGGDLPPNSGEFVVQGAIYGCDEFASHFAADSAEPVSGRFLKIALYRNSMFLRDRAFVYLSLNFLFRVSDSHLPAPPGRFFFARQYQALPTREIKWLQIFLYRN